MIDLTSAALITGVSLLAPLLIRLCRLPIPDVVGQIIAGIIIGPQLLGWARTDVPVQVLALVGLSFLLLLAGLEIDVRAWRKPVTIRTLAGFGFSFAVAVLAGYGLASSGLVRSPLLIAVVLSATSLGIILPILKDAGHLQTPFGQVVIAGASIAEIAPILLLSVLFSARGGGIVAPLALLVAFLGLVLAVGAAIAGVERSRRLTQSLLALQNTTVEIRVRGTLALLMFFVWLATTFGLEAILGAFLAGATLSALDRDEAMTHTLLRVKLQAIGFGVFVPFFFVSTGMSLDIRALIDPPSILARVPSFLAALLIVRSAPVLFYRRLAQRPRQLLAAGLFQATSLSIPVVAGSIGLSLGLITPSNYAALVAAGLLSVLFFPVLAVHLLGHEQPPAAQTTG